MKVIYSQDAEESLLSCLMISSEKTLEVMGFIVASDFYDKKNQILYEIIVDLFCEGVKIDIITLKQKILDKGFDKLLTMSYIAGISNKVTTTVNTKKYAETIKDKSIRRQLLEAQRKNEDTIYNEDESINKVLAVSQDNIFKISPLKNKDDSIIAIIRSLEKLQDEYAKKYESGKKLIGYSTGIEKLDNIIDGLRPGHFWVVGGWHGTGKTSFALNIVNSVLSQGVGVSIITLEMSQVDITAKMIGIREDVSSMMIIKGINTLDVNERIESGKLFMASSNLEIHSEFELDKIKMQIRKDVYTKETKVVLIDYLQKISAGNIYEETPLASKASKELANLAQELQITIILLSQISNEAQKGNGAGAGFKGSGTIEASADLAIVLKRDKTNENPEDEVVPVKIIITKNKFGLDGTINYNMKLTSGRFFEYNFPIINKTEETSVDDLRF